MTPLERARLIAEVREYRAAYPTTNWVTRHFDVCLEEIDSLIEELRQLSVSWQTEHDLRVAALNENARLRARLRSRLHTPTSTLPTKPAPHSWAHGWSG